MELFESDLAEVVDDNVRYILRCNHARREEVRATRQSKLDAVGALLGAQNDYLAGDPKAQTDVAKCKVAEKIRKLRLDGFVSVSANDNACEVSLRIDSLLASAGVTIPSALPYRNAKAATRKKLSDERIKN